MNYHLLKAGQRTQIKSLGSDLSDSIALLYVLNEIDSAKCPLEKTFMEDDSLVLAEKVSEYLDEL